MNSFFMKRFFTYPVLLFILSGFFIPSDKGVAYRYIKHNLSRGEVIEYRVHYGLINAGEATMEISDKLFRVNDRVCYKINVFGRSTGMFDMMLKIRDNWGTYLDTAAVVPHKFYRQIEEGKYRKHEVTEFDHAHKKAFVQTYNYKESKWRDKKEFSTLDNIQDLVSGYYFLRTIDFSKVKEGDILRMDVFFEDEMYDFKVRYLGIETLKTKIGKKEALVLSPIMPKNGLFDGENSIKVWLTNDPDKIPLKIKASMFVGAVEIDIKGYKGKRAH
jgi:hypothetical protein